MQQQPDLPDGSEKCGCVRRGGVIYFCAFHESARPLRVGAGQRDPIDECRQRLTAIYADAATLIDHHRGEVTLPSKDIREALESIMANAQLLTQEINGRLQQAWKASERAQEEDTNREG